MKFKLLASVAFAALAAVSGSANAGLLWGNNASFTGVIEAVDQNTLAVVHQYAIGPGNGRSVVTVGDIVYYTFVDDSRIHKLNANTGASLGSINTTIGSMSTLGWDGSQFWTSDYAGTNRAFRIDTTGAVTKTINLSLASSNMDGMEYFNGKLIANRCDACGVYDIYDLDGNVLVSNFINTGANATGIAFDGTDFLLSNIFANSISKYDGTTGLLISTNFIGGPVPATGTSQRLWEDLSVDYAARQDTGGVPEPTPLLLVGIAVLGLVASQRKRAR